MQNRLTGLVRCAEVLSFRRKVFQENAVFQENIRKLRTKNRTGIINCRVVEAELRQPHGRRHTGWLNFGFEHPGILNTNRGLNSIKVQLVATRPSPKISGWRCIFLDLLTKPVDVGFPGGGW